MSAEGDGTVAGEPEPEAEDYDGPPRRSGSRSLSPQLELLRQKGNSCQDLYIDDSIVEPMSLPVDPPSSMLGPMSLPANMAVGGVGGLLSEASRLAAWSEMTPGSPNSEPKTWPDQTWLPEGTPPTLRPLMLLGTPEDEAFAETAQTAVEEDGLDFRLALNRIGNGMAHRVEAAEGLSQLAIELGDASASLALVERRFTTLPTRPKGAMSPRKTAEDVVTGARAIEMLGNVMNTSGELRMGVANAMGELATVAAEQQTAEVGGSSKSSDGKSGGLFSGKKGVWKQIAEMVEGPKQHPVLGPVEKLAVQVQRATEEFEAALEAKLAWSSEPWAAEASDAARLARQRKKALDMLRLEYMRTVEQIHFDKEAEILEKASQVFFAQKTAVVALLLSMEEQEQEFLALQKQAKIVRARAETRERRREMMHEIVASKPIDTPAVSPRSANSKPTAKTAPTSAAKTVPTPAPETPATMEKGTLGGALEGAALDLMLSPQLKEAVAAAEITYSPGGSLIPPPSPAVRRLQVFKEKSGFVLIHHSKAAAKDNHTGTRWVRCWCTVTADGVLRYRQVPNVKAAGGFPYGRGGSVDSSNPPSSPAKLGNSTGGKGKGVKQQMIPLSRCRLDNEKAPPDFLAPVDSSVVTDSPGAGGSGGGSRGNVSLRALKRTMVRAGIEFTSEKAGHIEAGEVVVATEFAQTKAGQLRGKTDKGWVSMSTKEGTPIMVRAGRAYVLTLRRQPPAGRQQKPTGDGATSGEGNRPVIKLQAESAEEYEAWRTVLQEAADGATEAARVGLVNKVTAWLETIPIGGATARRYDPTELLEFGWAHGDEAETPETLYMHFVEHQGNMAAAEAEEMQRELVQMRLARMSEASGQACHKIAHHPMIGRARHPSHSKPSARVVASRRAAWKQQRPDGFYLVHRRAAVRQAFALNSTKRGIVEPGQIVEVTESKPGEPPGNYRVRLKPIRQHFSVHISTEGGWKCTEEQVAMHLGSAKNKASKTTAAALKRMASKDASVDLDAKKSDAYVASVIAQRPEGNEEGNPQSHRPESR